MKEYLLFDLDGTLTDSSPGITSCVQYALQSFGIDEPDLKKLECFIGPPLRDSFRKFYGFDDEKAEAAVWKYRERYADKGIYENAPYEGIPKMLKKLKGEGFHLAIASSKPQEYVERVLEHFKIRQYFQVIVGGNMDGSGDRKADVIEKVLKEFFRDKPVETDKVYMIGDRSYDIEGAKEMHVDSVGVSYGFGSVEELVAAKADYVVQSVWELEDFLMREVRAEEKKSTVTQKLWVMLYAFLLFFLVKNVALYAVNWVLLMLCENTDFPLAPYLLTWDEEGLIDGFTGNAATIVTAAGFIAGGLAIFRMAKKLIERARIDQRLSFLKPISGAQYGVMGITAILWVLGLNLLFDLSGITNLSASYQAVSEDQYAADYLVGILCYGMISPIAEELLFRGIFYNYLKRFLSVKGAIFVSSAFFGFYHGNMVQGVYAFLMGLLIAYAYEYFGDFKVAVIVHMIANITAYSLSYTVLAQSLDSGLGVPLCAVTLGMGIGGFLLLHRKKNVL